MAPDRAIMATGHGGSPASNLAPNLVPPPLAPPPIQVMDARKHCEKACLELISNPALSLEPPGTQTMYRDAPT